MKSHGGKKRSHDEAAEEETTPQEPAPAPRKNPEIPLRKLTTGLLETYKGINQKYYAKKKVGQRRCKLWRLMQIVGQYKDLLQAPDDEIDVSMIRERFIKAVNTWMWNHTTHDQCFAVETAFQRFMTSVMDPQGTSRACDDLMKLRLATDRFFLSIERKKLLETTFIDTSGNYLAEKGEMLDGRYFVEKCCGGGAFCKAWIAFDTKARERVCIKVVAQRKSHSDQSRREVKILKFLGEQSAERDYGIVRLKNHFVTTREHQCLVYPVLAYDLYELLKNEDFKGVSLKLVRKFAVQILSTLQLFAQPKIGLIHCDLKPENIMVANFNQTKVNVIDFGSSCFREEQGSTYVQSRFYRSPEVLLGIKYGTQIDVWSFGCILFEMYVGRPLFTGKDAIDQLTKIIQTLGGPNEAMLAQRRQFMEGTKEGNILLSKNKDKYVESFNYSERFRRIGYAVITRRGRTDEIKTDENGRVIDEDLLQFIDLLTKCLDLDPDTRITPTEALKHAFSLKLLQKAAQQEPAKKEENQAAAEKDKPEETHEEKDGTEEKAQGAEGPPAANT